GGGGVKEVLGKNRPLNALYAHLKRILIFNSDESKNAACFAVKIISFSIIKSKSLILFFALIFLPIDSFGQTSRFVKEYTYQLEDEDSKNSAKIKAQENLYKLLFMEVLVYVRKSNATAESSAADISVNLYKKAITATAQNKIKILVEKFDGFQYYIKGEIEVNIKEINAYAAQLNKIQSEQAAVPVVYSSTAVKSATNNMSSATSSVQTARNVTSNAANAIESVDKAAKALGGLGKVGGGLSGAANSARQVKSAVDNTLDAVESIQNITGGTGGQQGTDAVRNVTSNAANAIESADKAAKALGGLGKVGGGLSGVANSARQVKSAVDNTLDAVESVQNIADAVKGANSQQNRTTLGSDNDYRSQNFSSSSSPQKTTGGSSIGNRGNDYYLQHFSSASPSQKTVDDAKDRNKNSEYIVFSMRWEYVAMTATKGFGGCVEIGSIKENGLYNTFQFLGGNAYFGGELNIGGCFNKDGKKGNYKSVLGFNAGYRHVLKFVRFVSSDRYNYYSNANDDYDEIIGRNSAIFGGFWKLMFGYNSNFDITNKFMMGSMENPVSKKSSGEFFYDKGFNLTYVLSVGFTTTKVSRK
ncbi:MAG: hypothetical protein FWF51_08440, partial [Chitinivibrionia bacterium]|nr:hypothetical protein [Chitinivibrionia bacterium]